ncbi:GNAT family N-acetyltransferase [Streptomyces roseoverticillatus]|uniref:GNAT family N-acetyltransferase n=1 Tax=Streptomyces roseoverticillatus TaxID=66429 RepID=UPI001F491ECB|nr:GNAT family N-acetyltransferase [Streptomyces roseoverticillatus]MCF3101996.1 GNAT family N-acetyltransferase [Streptomyces roseoverticillatus]
MRLGPLTVRTGEGRPVLPAPGGVRRARAADAPALHALSEPFMRTGALRRRTPHVYAARFAEFFVAEDAHGTLEGCVALRAFPGDRLSAAGTAGVLHNFCVRPDRQRRGVGSRLLTALLLYASDRSVTEVFAATTGDGEAFLRSGFRETDSSRAPHTWVAALDPARGSRVFARPLPGAALPEGSALVQPWPARHCRASTYTR